MKKKIYLLVATDYKDTYETKVDVFSTLNEARAEMKKQYDESLAKQDLTGEPLEYDYQLNENTATIREENLWNVHLDWIITKKTIDVDTLTEVQE